MRTRSATNDLGSHHAQVIATVLHADHTLSTPAGGRRTGIHGSRPAGGETPRVGPRLLPRPVGPAWADTDHNGCDQRNDVLQRDLTGVRLRAGSRCLVASGVLHDPYTGKTISFARGPKTSDAVQIDHVVALDDAWQTGAATWTTVKRQQLATDERLELLAVDGPTNQAKGDADAASWLPPKTGFQCRYVAAQIAVKATYGLWVTPSERAAMARVLATCPSQQLPA